MKKQNGITLIALVVTIVVLLILAGVALNLVLGENGIITRGQEAKIAHEVGAEKEDLKLNVADWEISKKEDTFFSFMKGKYGEGNVEDLVTYGDFLENEFFNSFVITFKKLHNAAANGVDKVDDSKIIAALTIMPEAKKSKKKKKLVKTFKEGFDELPINKIVRVDKAKFNEAIANGKYLANGEENIKKGIQDANDVIGSTV